MGASWHGTPRAAGGNRTSRSGRVCGDSSGCWRTDAVASVLSTRARRCASLRQLSGPGSGDTSRRSRGSRAPRGDTSGLVVAPEVWRRDPTWPVGGAPRAAGGLAGQQPQTSGPWSLGDSIITRGDVATVAARGATAWASRRAEWRGRILTGRPKCGGPRSTSMQLLSAKPWFRRRRVGLGWRPVTWQGWLVTAVAAGLVIAVLAAMRASSARIPIAVLILALYAIVALLTGGVRGQDHAQPAADRPGSATVAPSVSGGNRAPASPAPRPRSAPSTPAAPMLVVEHLTKAFDERVAVDDVSFSVAAGEVFGFLGPNGAGKTTTVRVLATLIAPTSGSALVAGHPARTRQRGGDPAAHRRHAREPGSL